MPSFRPITEDELPARGTRTGGVSGTILQEFLDSGQEMVEVVIDEGELNRKGEPVTVNSLRSTLATYAAGHKLNVEPFTQGGKLVLRRLDAPYAPKPRARKADGNGAEAEAE